MITFEQCDVTLIFFIVLAIMCFFAVEGLNLDKPITYFYFLLVMCPFILYYLSRATYIYGTKLLNYFNRNKFENQIDIEIENHNNIN